MALITPSSAAGSGRGGARRSAAKSGAKRLAGLLGRTVLGGIGKNDFKRLARRAGELPVAAVCSCRRLPPPAAACSMVRPVSSHLLTQPPGLCCLQA